MTRIVNTLGLCLFVATTVVATAETLSAATLRTIAYAGFETADGKNETRAIVDEDNSNADAISEASRALSAPGGEGSSSGSASGDMVQGEFATFANANKVASTAPSAHQGYGIVDAQARYTAVGDMRVTVSLDLVGEFAALTDRPLADRLVGVGGSLSIFSPGLSFLEARGTDLTGDPLNGLASGSFTDQIAATFDLADGEAFDLQVRLRSVAGDVVSPLAPAVLLQSFYDARSTMSAFLSIETDGGSLISGDSTISPVPLPAGLPMLVAALGGLGYLSRKRKNARL